MGNGHDAKVIQDEWVPGLDNPFAGQQVMNMSSLRDLKVGSLIDWSRRTFAWHEPLVEAIFPRDVAR